MEGLSQDIKEIIISELTFPNPKYNEMIKMGRSTYRIPEELTNFEIIDDNTITIPRGMLTYLLNVLTAYGIKTEMVDERTYVRDMKIIDSRAITYRAYQEYAIDKLVNAGTEGILVAPPGSGKTVMGLSLMAIFQQPMLWVTHTDRLLKQSVERAKQFLKLDDSDIGIIGSGNWDTDKIFTIGMVQTLIRNLDKLNEIKDNFGLVVIDECHHLPSTTFSKIISGLNPYFLYGLTATPYRRDGLEKIMFQNVGPVLCEISKNTVANDGGIIAPQIIHSPIRSERVDGNDIIKIFKENIIFNKDRNDRIVRDILREANAGNFCIVASGRRAHCDLLYDILKKKWPKTGVATGKYSKKEIDKQVGLFDTNGITILVTTPDLLGEGFDVDFLNRLFIATPFRTESRVEQLIGRVQRFHKDKKDALVYDYVDTDVGVLANQYYSKYGKCRSNVYKKLGLKITPYDTYMKDR